MEGVSTLSTPATLTATTPWMLWIGRGLTALPILALLAGSVAKLLHASPVLAVWTPQLGYQHAQGPPRRCWCGGNRPEPARSRFITAWSTATPMANR